MAFPDDVLDEGERVALHCRPHWWSCLRPAAVLPLVCAVAGFAAAVVRLQAWAPQAWALLGVLGLLAALRWSVLPIARWRCTHLLVTGTRLLARDGIVATRVVEVPVDRIDAVRVRARRRERLLGAGTLLVEAAGERYTFTDVPRVDRAQARLHREIGRSAVRARSVHLERLRATRRSEADGAVRDRSGTHAPARTAEEAPARDRMTGWGAAEAAPERTAS